MATLPPNPTQANRTCPICNHPNRAEIEQLVLSVSPSNPLLTLDAIADAYCVDPRSLRVHALMHTPLALDFTQQSETLLADTFRAKQLNTDMPPVGTNDDVPPPLPSDQLSQLPLTDEEARLVQSAGGVSDQINSNPTTLENPLSLRNRMTDSINLREGDMLLATANEMLTTLGVIGRKIKQLASYSDDMADQRLANFCTNSMVNLYIGTSAEVRKAIEAINALNTSVNGEHDSAADGLKALAQAISGNASPSTSDQPTDTDTDTNT